jgi:hypothetical protein
MGGESSKKPAETTSTTSNNRKKDKKKRKKGTKNKKKDKKVKEVEPKFVTIEDLHRIKNENKTENGENPPQIVQIKKKSVTINNTKEKEKEKTKTISKPPPKKVDYLKKLRAENENKQKLKPKAKPFLEAKQKTPPPQEPEPQQQPEPEQNPEPESPTALDDSQNKNSQIFDSESKLLNINTDKLDDSNFAESRIIDDNKEDEQEEEQEIENENKTIPKRNNKRIVNKMEKVSSQHHPSNSFDSNEDESIGVKSLPIYNNSIRNQQEQFINRSTNNFNSNRARKMRTNYIDENLFYDDSQQLSRSPELLHQKDTHEMDSKFNDIYFKLGLLSDKQSNMHTLMLQNREMNKQLIALVVQNTNKTVEKFQKKVETRNNENNIRNFENNKVVTVKSNNNQTEFKRFIPRNFRVQDFQLNSSKSENKLERNLNKNVYSIRSNKSDIDISNIKETNNSYRNKFSKYRKINNENSSSSFSIKENREEPRKQFKLYYKN